MHPNHRIFGLVVLAGRTLTKLTHRVRQVLAPVARRQGQLRLWLLLDEWDATGNTMQSIFCIRLTPRTCMRKRPSIAVLGAGALGAPVAGLLANAGHDVVLLDPWVEH